MNDPVKAFWEEIDSREHFRNSLWQGVKGKYAGFLKEVAYEKFGAETAEMVISYLEKVKGYAFRYDVAIVEETVDLATEILEPIRQMKEADPELTFKVLKLRRSWLNALQDQKATDTKVGFFIGAIDAYLRKQEKCAKQNLVERMHCNFNNIEKVEEMMHSSCDDFADRLKDLDQEMKELVAVITALCVDVFSADFYKNLKLYYVMQF